MSILRPACRLFSPVGNFVSVCPSRFARPLTHVCHPPTSQFPPYTSRVILLNFHPSPFFYPARNTFRHNVIPCCTTKRPFFTDPSEQEKEIAEKKTSLMQRFKESYAIYGKVLLIVHGIGSCFWFAAAYLVAKTGINLLELFEAAHFPEWMCRPLRMGGGSVNTVATALVLYKVVSPLRYGLTLVIARYTVHYLRAKGKAPQLTDQDRLRNLAREGARLSGERVKYRLSKSRKAAIAFSKSAGRTLTTKGRR